MVKIGTIDYVLLVKSKDIKRRLCGDGMCVRGACYAFRWFDLMN